MSSIRVSGNTSGYYDLTVPDVAGTNTIPLNQVVTTDASGNLGVGTATPVTSLHVAKAGNGIVTVERTNKVSGTGYFGINVENNSQTTLAFDNTSNFVIGRSGDPSTQAGFNNDFLISSTGDVGIGSAQPNNYTNWKTLTLNGTNGAGGEIDFDSDNTLQADLFAGTSAMNIRHHTGEIKMYAGGTGASQESIRLQNGTVMFPNMPNFATRINYNGTAAGGGSVVTNWHTPHVNQGGHFNSSNGRFTAPYSGSYRFDFHTNVLRSGSGVYYLDWYKNGSNIMGTQGGRIYGYWTGGWENTCGFVVLNLSANDYVEFVIGGDSITLDGNTYGQYTGYMLSTT